MKHAQSISRSCIWLAAQAAEGCGPNIVLAGRARQKSLPGATTSKLRKYGSGSQIRTYRPSHSFNQDRQVALSGLYFCGARSSAPSLTATKGWNMEFLSLQSMRSYRCALRHAVFAVLFSLLASQCLAQQPTEGPFAGLPGSWTGTGIIALSSGAKERIRCRATYRLDSSSVNLRLDLSCTSDNYKFELHSNISYNDHVISGTWNESTRGVGGNITGSATGNQIRARAEGQTFSAILVVNTRGPRQSVSIQSPGSEMSEITIELTRGSR